MVAMLVKLLLALIASITSPATSLEVSFSRSKYASSPLIFSPFFCSLFFCSIVYLSKCEMETSCSGWLGLLPAYLRLLEVFHGVPLLVLELPENISARRLQRVLAHGLLYKGLFACCRWMITNLICWGFQGVIYSGQAGLTFDKVIATLATINYLDEKSNPSQTDSVHIRWPNI